MDSWDDETGSAEPDPFTDSGALWAARNPEDLWRALVTHPGRRTTHHWEAVQLFRRHHEDGTSGALRTALLLCTDRRWERCTARLIAEIIDALILGEDDLKELADCFVWSDSYPFQYPMSWIGAEWVSIDLDGRDDAVEGSVQHLDPSTPVSSDRPIAPPLRRWAAAHVLRIKPNVFDAMRVRAGELGARDGGAVVAGILDAIEAVDEDVAQQAIDLALGWPRGSVRILVLDLLAVRDPEAANNRAVTDPDQKVRRWTPRSSRRSPASVSEEDPAPGGLEARSAGATNAQATLFQEQ